MCKTRHLVAINQLSLGNRVLGVETLSLPKGEVLEFTYTQLRNIIKGGKDKVYGLKIAENGTDLEFDKEGFFTTNMMNKVHIGSLTPMVESENMINFFYVIIGTEKNAKGETMYQAVSSRFERLLLNESKVRNLIEFGVISGGCKLGDNGEIIVASMEEAKPVEKKTVAKPEIAKATKTENTTK